ncbi:glycine betaine ABC transporter substrate-binding protein [Pseudomonas sp. NPDC078700]|uniref:glycine betaine ABC transporter substrate-binding protein n=1 Tax=Pseudomonas sp. NPDC078700 TaxID=3364424 RepID=UPI0037CAAB71
MKTTPFKCLVGCLVLQLASTSVQAAEPAQCKNVRFGLMSWTDVIATTAVARTLFERLGYSTKETIAAQQMIYSGMRNKQVDVFLGHWSPSSNAIIGPFVDEGAVEILPEPNMADGQMTLVVPTWLAEKGLKTFADISRFEEELDGRIYGIDPGTNINKRLQQAIKDDRFGLKDFKLIESSEAGMLAAVKRANQRKDGIVFIGWKPHPMNISMDLTYLTGSDGLMGPEEGKATVWNVARAGYAEECPNAYRLLGNIHFTAEQEAKMMVKLLGHAKPMDVAQDFIDENPELIKSWLAGTHSFSGENPAP